MEQIFDILIVCLAAVPVGILMGNSAVYVFNNIPASWLCDYGEKPDEKLLSRERQRLNSHPNKLLFSAFFIALGIFMGIVDYAYAAAALVEMWLLLLIGLADKKYMIIPDQFVVFLAILAFPLARYQESLWHMAGGLLLGGITMLLISIIGKLILRQEALGFGDVKLMSALGLTAGFTGTAFILVLTSFLSGGFFAVGLMTSRIKKNETRPLGPFIALSGAIYLLLKSRVLF